MNEDERNKALQVTQPAPLHRLGVCLRTVYSGTGGDKLDDEMARLLQLLSHEGAETR